MLLKKLLNWLLNVGKVFFTTQPEQEFLDEDGNLCIWKLVPMTDDEFWTQALSSSGFSPIGLEYRLPVFPFKREKSIITPAAKASE